MAIARNVVDTSKFNPSIVLLFELRREDFQLAMQDAYDFFFDGIRKLRENWVYRA